MKESVSASFRRALPVLVPFLLCAMTPLCVGFIFGRGWRLVFSVIGIAVWLAWRPWRYGVASPLERDQARVGGTIGLAGFVINYFVIYYHI